MSELVRPKQVEGELLSRRGSIYGLELTWFSVDQVKIGVGVATAASDDSLTINVTSVLTADLSTSGANGLDTGVRTINTWYHLHVIKGTSGVASLWSLSRTAPTLPAGYTQGSRWVGSFYNVDDGFSGDIREISYIQGIEGERVFFLANPDTQGLALSSSLGATWTDLSLSSFCPPTSRLVRVEISIYGRAPGAGVFLRQDGNTTPLGQVSAAVIGSKLNAMLEVPMSTAQAIEYLMAKPAGRLSLAVLAYSLSLSVS